MNIEWDAVSDTGGTTILSYNLQFDDASNGANWFDVQGEDGSESTTLTYTSPPSQVIIGGQTYRFRVRAKNVHGWSAAFSPELLVLASDVPA